MLRGGAAGGLTVRGLLDEVPRGSLRYRKAVLNSCSGYLSLSLGTSLEGLVIREPGGMSRGLQAAGGTP